jgi:hypothetical protein
MLNLLFTLVIVGLAFWLNFRLRQSQGNAYLHRADMAALSVIAFIALWGVWL